MNLQKSHKSYLFNIFLLRHRGDSFVNLNPKMFSVFCLIILQVIYSPAYSQQHIDYSFDPSLAVSPTIRSVGSGALTIDLTASNRSLPQLFLLTISTHGINCRSEKCFAHITFDGEEIWRKNLFYFIARGFYNKPRRAISWASLCRYINL